MNPRERQHSVYAGEEAALAGAGRMFRDLREVRIYLDDLIGSDWWADRWPHVEAIPVGRTRSGRFSGYAVEGTGEIRVGSLREPVVLHEVAHVVTPGGGHGPAFVDALPRAGPRTLRLPRVRSPAGRAPSPARRGRGTPMILINLKIQIRADRRDEWLDRITKYAKACRDEPGNNSFDVYESIESPNEFSIIESFVDQAAGGAHCRPTTSRTSWSGSPP